MRSRIVQGLGSGILGLCLTIAASGTSAAQECVGDCNGDGVVSINELITAVNIDLGSGLFNACPALACSCGAQGICCVIAAVNNALNGCNQAVLPHLALNVQTNDLPGQHQVDIVATLDHLGGSPIFYVEGCTAQCYPQFLRPITFDVVGPSGPVIIDNCGAPTYCPEGFMSFSPAESLQQVLSVTGSAFEQGCNASDGIHPCTTTDLLPGHYTATARFSYSATPEFGAPQYGISETVGFDWPSSSCTADHCTPSVTATGSPTLQPTPVTPSPTPVLDCSGVPEGQDCIGPCGPCNSSMHGYCHLGQCMTECAPCVTPTPVIDCDGAPAYAPCVAGCGQGVCYGTVCSAAECTPSVTATATCGESPPPTCSPGELVCSDLRCGQGCSCASRTPTLPPTQPVTPTPTASPYPSCDGDACDSQNDCLTYGINGDTIPGHCQHCQCVPINCGEVEWIYGCCDFGGQQPCYTLNEGSLASQCMYMDHGNPEGCYGSVSCNAATGLCESARPTPTPTPPAGRCRDSNECQQGGGRCLAPGAFPGCGPTPAPVPTLDRCQVDTDCRSRGEDFICTPVDPRTCEIGLVCVAGCKTDADCAVGEACDPTHRCAPRPCASDTDCPPLFACSDLPEGQRGCYRRTCVTDPDCIGGFCVTGSCYDQLGACATPPA